MKYLLLIILSLYFLKLQCQPLSISENQQAHKRYWYFRTRMINDFLKVGDRQGDCICFAERNEGVASKEGKVGPDQIDLTNMYLATLALEYKLLTRANQSTQETVKEIYYFLKTIDRLDNEADQFWEQNVTNDHLNNSNGNNKLNGFILREDMPHDYFKPDINYQPGYVITAEENRKHFNYAFNEYDYTQTSTESNRSYCGLYQIDSLDDDNHFSNYNGFVPPRGAKVIDKLPLVQDKYYSMLFAFMMLIKYIPDNTGYYENGQLKYFNDGYTWDIKTQVRNIANRCHSYLRGNVFGNQNSDWVMRYPNGSALDYINLGSPNPFFLYPIVNTICHLNNNYPWSYSCLSYADIQSLDILPYVSISSTNAFTQDNAVFLAWNHVNSNVYPGAMPLWLKMMQNTGQWNLQWADLARKVLHQTGQMTRNLNLFADPIKQAPCQGPYNFYDCNYGGFEWSSQDRTEHPNSRGNGCGNSNITFRGNYPGVDYMLLHNLYYEYLNQKDDGPGQIEQGAYKNAYNLMDNYDEQTWPVYHVANGSGFNPVAAYLIGVKEESVTQVNLPGPGGPVPFVKAPGRVKLFQNLESRAQIYASASPAAPNNTISSKVEYRAGKEITLLPENGSQPGFEVKLGSDFSAYIKRYVCTGNNDPLLQRPGSSSTEERSNDFETDLMNTEIPIHHVDHPKSDSDLYPGEMTTDQYAGQEINEIQNILLTEYQNESPEKINTIQKELLTQRLVVLPNPNNGVFRIYATRISDEETFNYSILDMKGQVILNEQNIKSGINKEIDLSQYAEGIYMLQLSSNLGYKFNKRITVIR